MTKQSPKPPIVRASGWGATGSSDGKRRFLTSEQFAEIRRKRADLYAKLRQMTAAELCSLRGQRSMIVANLLDPVIYDFYHLCADSLDHFPILLPSTVEK